MLDDQILKWKGSGINVSLVKKSPAYKAYKAAQRLAEDSALRIRFNLQVNLEQLLFKQEIEETEETSQWGVHRTVLNFERWINSDGSINNATVFKIFDTQNYRWVYSNPDRNGRSVDGLVRNLVHNIFKAIRSYINRTDGCNDKCIFNEDRILCGINSTDPKLGEKTRLYLLPGMTFDLSETYSFTNQHHALIGNPYPTSPNDYVLLTAWNVHDRFSKRDIPDIIELLDVVSLITHYAQSRDMVEILIGENTGLFSGETKNHPHWRIKGVREKSKETRDHEAHYRDLNLGHPVYDSDSFAVFVNPYVNGEIILQAKDDRPYILDASQDEKTELAGLLKALHGYHDDNDFKDYNVSLQQSPLQESSFNYRFLFTHGGPGYVRAVFERLTQNIYCGDPHDKVCNELHDYLKKSDMINQEYVRNFKKTL